MPENHSSDSLTPDSASSYIETSNNSLSNVHREFTFHKKGIHVANLNVRHILPILDELQITLGVANSPDITGICETFLDPTVNDTQLYINDYDFIRKDRYETKDKSGGGLILYHRKSLKCFRRKELEISKNRNNLVRNNTTKLKTVSCMYGLPSAKFTFSMDWSV